MPVTPDALARARNLKPSAVAEVLTEHYAPVHRLAHGLCGRPDVARGVVRYVMGRSIARLPSWDDEIDPENWFHHFTVLATRRARAGRGRPDPKGGEDALLGDAAGMPEPAYVAFLTALRNLPEQQQEAFILHHGERVGLRSLSLSMDCSTEAANNHLKAATETLQLVAGDRFDAFTMRLGAAYRRLTPTEELALPLVNRVIRRRVWPRRIARWLGRLLVVAILGAIAWVAWRLYGNVDV